MVNGKVAVEHNENTKNVLGYLYNINDGKLLST